MTLNAAQLDELSMSPRRIDRVDVEMVPNVELKALWEQAAREVEDLESAKSEPLTEAQLKQLSEQAAALHPLHPGQPACQIRSPLTSIAP